MGSEKSVCEPSAVSNQVHIRWVQNFSADNNHFLKNKNFNLIL